MHFAIDFCYKIVSGGKKNKPSFLVICYKEASFNRKRLLLFTCISRSASITFFKKLLRNEPNGDILKSRLEKFKGEKE